MKQARAYGCRSPRGLRRGGESSVVRAARAVRVLCARVLVAKLWHREEKGSKKSKKKK